MKSFHGRVVGRRAKAGWVCDGCGHIEKKKPDALAQPCCPDSHYEYFKSHAEMKRWGELRLLLATDKISELEREVRYDLHAANSTGPSKDGRPRRVGFYKADFRYKLGDVTVVEDVKGKVDTHMSKWKRRHAEMQYGIIIIIVKR